MAWALALPVVAGLLHAAAAGGELSARIEGRSTTLSAEDAPARIQSRGSASATPAVSGFVAGAPLRLGVTYAPRIWTSDLGSGEAPYVNHAADARLQLRGETGWHAEASGAAVRGRTDPLADLALATPGNAQLATTSSTRYEELRAAGTADTALGARTTLAAAAGFGTSRTLGAASTALPPQRALSLEVTLGRLATERDTLGLTARAARTVTSGAGAVADARADVATVVGAWRRRLTPRVDGWAGGGVILSSSEELGGTRRRDLLPSAEAGVSRAGDAPDPTVAAVAHLTTAVDRFSGAPHPTVDAALTVAWPAAPRVAVSATAFAGARTDGETSVGGGEGRVTWALRERLALEAGVRARWQHERRPVAPSFLEAAVFAGVAWTTGVLGTAPAPEATAPPLGPAAGPPPGPGHAPASGEPGDAGREGG